MKRAPETAAPADALQRRTVKPVVVYAIDKVPRFDAAFYAAARQGLTKIGEVIVQPRDGGAFEVPAGHLFRIVSIEGSQVGDLNLWNAHDLSERFFSGKTRALHATHVTTGNRLWSTLPYLRPALIGSAAISFIMSFENFNTTLMLVGADAPLTIMMYGRMREGASPVLNAVSLFLMLASAALALTLMRGGGSRPSSSPAK